MPPARSAAAVLIVAVHVAGLVALGGGAAATSAARPTIVIHDIPGAPLPEAPPPPLVLAAIAVDVAVPAIEIAGDGPAAASGECRLATALQAALAGDGAVRRALAAVPAEDRSLANAVMVWDGHWAPATALGGTPRANPVREVVVDQIHAASPDCRQAAITGPRLLVVTATESPTALAFGSGVWRWADLLS